MIWSTYDNKATYIFAFPRRWILFSQSRKRAVNSEIESCKCTMSTRCTFKTLGYFCMTSCQHLERPEVRRKKGNSVAMVSSSSVRSGRKEHGEQNEEIGWKWGWWLTIGDGDNDMVNKMRKTVGNGDVIKMWWAPRYFEYWETTPPQNEKVSKIFEYLSKKLP